MPDSLPDQLHDLSVDLREINSRWSLVAQLAAERLAEVEDRLARYERYQAAVDALRPLRGDDA